MPTRTRETPPSRPDTPRTPARPHDEVRSFETLRGETAANRDTTDETARAAAADDINTHGSER